MDSEYKLQAYRTPSGSIFWELISGTATCGDFAKMLKTPRKKQAAVNLINQIDKIISHGIKASCATGKLRLLDAELGLYELKGYSGVNREMAYILYQEPLRIVLLFSFKGASGKRKYTLRDKEGSTHCKSRQRTLSANHASRISSRWRLI